MKALFVLLATLPIANVCAAPKKPVASKAVPIQWEYCLIDTGSFVNGGRNGYGYGVRVTFPKGRTFIQPGDATNKSVVLDILNRLGAQGWEVIGYANGGGYKDEWTLKRRK